MPITNDEIQQRNKKLQGDLATAQANRAKLKALASATKPTGYANAGGFGAIPSPMYGGAEQRMAGTQGRELLAANTKEMQRITTEGNAITRDANAFVANNKANKLAATYGVQLPAPNNAQPAPASPTVNAGATAPAGVAPTNPTGPIKLTMGDPNTYTDANGVVKAVPGLLAAAGNAQPAAPTSPVIAAANNRAAQVQGANTNAQTAAITAGRLGQADATAFLNPLNPQAEIMRRLEMSQTSAAGRGSPQARRLLAEAIMGQLGAANNASAIQQRDLGGIAATGARLEADSQEAFAARQQDASKVNANAQQIYDAMNQELNKPQYVTDAAGNFQAVRNGVASPVADANGAALKMAQGDTSNDRLKSLAPIYVELLKGNAATIADPLATPEAKAEAQTRTQQIQALLGGGQEQPAASEAPKAGTVVDGYKFKGGNPSDKANWEKVNQ